MRHSRRSTGLPIFARSRFDSNTFAASTFAIERALLDLEPA